jgi:hypothetical protein
MEEEEEEEVRGRQRAHQLFQLFFRSGHSLRGGWDCRNCNMYY